MPDVPRLREAKRRIMRVMVPINSNKVCLAWAEKFPDQFGFLIGPSYYGRNPIRPNVVHAADNDAFKAFKDHQPWDELAYFDMLDQIKNPLMFVVVPDIVTDKPGTLRNWDKYSERVRQYGFPLAFAVQDGMQLTDVPPNADLVFVGGTTEWKWRTSAMWCSNFQTHIGRVNKLSDLERAESMGAISVDGSGWHRDPKDWDRNYHGLHDWFNGFRYRDQQSQLL